MRPFLLLSLLVIGGPSTAQPVRNPLPTAPAAMLDASARQSLVDALSQALRERYVFLELGEEAALGIRSALDAGQYDTLADPTAFADRLTEDLRSIVHDRHMAVVSMTTPPRHPPRLVCMSDFEAVSARIGLFGDGEHT